MSHPQNYQWLDAALENFQDALDDGNYPLAKDIIADTFDAGFADVAQIMTNKLRGYPISHFAKESPYA